MKIAICFGGELGRSLAEEVKAWLAAVLDADPFFAPHDIAKGEEWFRELERALRAADAAVLCLTDDRPGPWVCWEAGKARFPYPLAFDFEPRRLLEGPLGKYQLTRFDPEDMWRLAESLSRQENGPRFDAERLRRKFRKTWPGLKSRIAKILKAKPRSFVEQVVGPWWEGVVAEEGTAVSYIRAEPSQDQKSLRFNGAGYGKDGRCVAEWNSRIVLVDPEKRQIFYSWAGMSENARDGMGEFTFAVSADGTVNQGSGSFSDRDPTGRHTMKRSLLLRATAAEQAIMDSTNHSAKAKLARKKIRELS